jgi:hypothetical protein
MASRASAPTLNAPGMAAKTPQARLTTEGSIYTWHIRIEAVKKIHGRAEELQRTARPGAPKKNY